MNGADSTISLEALCIFRCVPSTPLVEIDRTRYRILSNVKTENKRVNHFAARNCEQSRS